MKSFLQFISEAETQASSQEPKNMGLSGDGHGDWYDKQGKLVAKTVNGRLKFFGNRNLGKKIEIHKLLHNLNKKHLNQKKIKIKNS